MSYQSVSEALGKWVNKPLAKLPRDLQPIATAYIPRWKTLTPKQRTDRAIEVDRQRGLKSKLRYDRATRTQQAAHDPARGAVGWHDATLDADHHAARIDIPPIDAAMLLCRFNPNENSYDDARQTTTDELGPEHLVRLAQRLADIDKADHKPRTLRDWHQTARGLGLTYHSWIDGYIEATTPPAPPVADTAPPEPPAAAVGDWVEVARTRAAEIVKEQRGRDLFPSQESIGYTIATEFRKAGIVGTDGKPLAGATIKRHALKGISSAVDKQLSTTIRQGK